MDEELALVTDWLVCASSQVASEYMQLPVAGNEDPEYRERVYCYELYHRWRLHWPDRFAFSLCGEVDKAGHPLIRENTKPDFLVHVPGCMKNMLVVEVKPKNADVARMAADLAKLTRFCREPANYHAAYFWLYGLSADDWPRLNDKIAAIGHANEVDHSLIKFFVHERAGAMAIPVNWQLR